MKKPVQFFKRSEPGKIYSRLSSPNRPKTVDEAARSVEFVAATEQPVVMYDWERGAVDEILLIDGVVIPTNGQVPFCDSHNRGTVDDILGSMRNFLKSEILIGTAFLAKDQKAYDTFRKIADGHITDVSVCYNVVDSIFCDPGQTITYKNKTYKAGPDRVLKLSTKWELKEVSATAIGADDKAKARSESPVSEPEKPAPQAPKKEAHFKMNRKLYNLLISRGLAAGSTDAEALAFLAALPTVDQESIRAESNKPEPTPAVDESALRAKIEKEISERNSTIRESCRAVGIPEFADELTGCKTVDEARAKIIEKLAKAKPGVPVSIGLVADETDKFRNAVIDGMLIKQGCIIDKPAAGNEDFRNMVPTRLAEECLRMQGVNTRALTKAQMLRMIMKRGAETISHGTAHFPLILENIANKMAIKGFQEAPRLWPLIAAVKSVSDFREFSLAGISNAEDLDEVQELAHYTEGEFNEIREKAKLVKYGKKFTISWEGMLADDLGEFTTVPRKHANAAGRTINKLPFAVLTGNPVMRDGKTLFHADHNNIVTPAALSSTSIGLMASTMKNQYGHGKDSEILDIEMSRIITGNALGFSLKTLVAATSLPDSGISVNVPNPNYGIIPVSTGLISSAGDAYGSADPNAYDTIVMAFLDGDQTPYLEEIYQTDVDGYAFKVRICAVAKAVDWLGLNYKAAS